MSIVFEAYTAPPAQLSGTLSGANEAPRASFVGSGMSALLGRQRAPKFGAVWEAGALVGRNGAPAGRFWNGTQLMGRLGAPSCLFAEGPALTGAMLYGCGPSPVWGGTSTYAETWDGDLGTHPDPAGLFVVPGFSALRAHQLARPIGFFQQAVVAQNTVGLLLGLYTYIGAAGVPSNLAVSSLALGDAALPDAVLALLDLFQLSDGYTQQALALQALADGLTLADVAQMILQADLLDSFIASAVPTGMAQLTVLLADTLDLSDSASALSQVLAAIADGFYVSITLSTGQDTYTAWVMTPETKAVRTYSNYPFNSFAQLGAAFYGAGEAGVYQMGGATDAGAAIQATLRTGWMDLGSKKLKRIDRAYIGATTSGDLLLKVQATTYDDTLLEQTYRMMPAVTDGPREHRVAVGRGFRSVYWTFELANDVDGADFELHDLQVLPMVLSGRVL